MPYFKGSYIEASFFKTTLNFRHCHYCKIPLSIGRPMDRRYFNQEATSAIFSKNFLTNFFFGLLFGLSRCLPIRGTIFRKPLIRSPVIKKTGWLKCQWCGVNPLPDDSPLLGCRGRIWETYIILTQMGCKPICDARAGIAASSLYIVT